ncbi:helix-turn-helix transcriptional regulator [Streptomyces spinosirectus]|jgi:DNA-binding HxlR family transcriptional regulator|uniref:winged helix-turn-helix transcriptional regulator n=1 Tax=Streptomyces TaxID=1883 RepID=UPI000FFF27D7|nr:MULTISPECIES: helix-turn-helix domain-containing protein [Streptomyces]MBY8340133.1 helix-turn-helix transcriptional regulator [Streptomyces plumbidurans]UIR18906.1 helix-turn-helix transcriptional regulator [Streptomyces spinosirectus]
MATMTAAQKREQARTAYDAFLRACPTNQLLDRLSDKWVSLVLAALSSGPMRYSDLSRKIAGVSPKMLTQTLRALERDGLVTRTVTPSVPVRVDYELTELGGSLAQLMTAVKTWAETHFDEVHAAREQYDAGNAAAS